MSGSRIGMADLTGKESSERCSIASGTIRIPPAVVDSMLDCSLPKGDAIAAATVAGIQAAKNAAGLVPLCHPVSISWIGLTFHRTGQGLSARCEVRGRDFTGFEMEALAGVCGALLTLYDMIKGSADGASLENIRLDYKSGGDSGEVGCRPAE